MKTKAQKKSIIDELKTNFEKAKAVVFLNLHKFNTSNLFKLKKELKSNEGELKVAKKTLLDLANNNIDAKKIPGPFAVIFDFSSNFKPFSILGKLKKELGIEVFGGSFGDKILSEKEIWGITELPSEDILQSKLVFVLKSRFNNITTALKSPINKLVIVLNQISNKQ